MRFALLGDHPDALDMACALVGSGRHEIVSYTGPPAGVECLRRWGITVEPVRDLEEVLADPSIDAVIVGSRPADRPAHLRRALQSERHVLCVHPADHSPDIAYEAALIQGDTQRVLLPLLPESLHPAFGRLAGLIRAQEGPLGAFQLLQMERGLGDVVLIDGGHHEQKLSLPGWDVLRSLGGEVAEVFALHAKPAAGDEESAAGEPLLLTGRFEGQGLFQVIFLPGQTEARWHVAVIGNYGRAEVVFPQGWPGPASLFWQPDGGEACEEHWPIWNPWPTLVEVFEEKAALETRSAERGARSAAPDRLTAAALHAPRFTRDARPGGLTWQTAVRCLELDDAARRSMERGRVSTLEYPEATEEAGFKGTMTLVGCGLLWFSLLLLLLSAWVSWLKWAIVPLLVGFLGLQLLRWIVPGSRAQEAQEPGAGR
jgi:predicted dehydrogenase